MQMSVVELTMVYAVIDQQLGSSSDGIIAAIYADPHAAALHVCLQVDGQSAPADQVWRVSEFPVRALLGLSDELSTLFVVYESDADGIRPLHLYASERLAQCKVQECQSRDQLRRLTDELSGHAIAPKSYWWECCPVIR